MLNKLRCPSFSSPNHYTLTSWRVSPKTASCFLQTCSCVARLTISQHTGKALSKEEGRPETSPGPQVPHLSSQVSNYPLLLKATLATTVPDLPSVQWATAWCPGGKGTSAFLGAGEVAVSRQRVEMSAPWEFAGLVLYGASAPHHGRAQLLFQRNVWIKHFPGHIYPSARLCYM